MYHKMQNMDGASFCSIKGALVSKLCGEVKTHQIFITHNRFWKFHLDMPQLDY